MKRYSAGIEEQFFIGHFDDGKRKKKEKSLREWHLHPESKKLFINMRLGGESGLRRAVRDGVQMYFYPDSDGELFVNVDWMIERAIMGPKETITLQALKDQVLENNKELIKEFMDKQIKKVKKDVEKGDKKKAEKDISKLQKMDKKFDKEIDECKDMKKSKKK